MEREIGEREKRERAGEVEIIRRGRARGDREARGLLERV